MYTLRPFIGCLKDKFDQKMSVVAKYYFGSPSCTRHIGTAMFWSSVTIEAELTLTFSL
jgi:hypothetical protein